MDFGKVESEALEHIDFTLPPDAAQTTRVLAAGKGHLQVYVGCAKWGRPDWIGKIYPKGTKAGDFLLEYAKRFNSIELNAIYYQLPSPQQLQAWLSKVGPGFIFCPKFSDVITHKKRLKNIEQELNAFLDCIYRMGPHLGPVFLMPHPQMGPKHRDTILSFLEQVPSDLDLFVELRHPEWYQQPHMDDLFGTLEQMQKGSIITDAAGRRDCVHMRLTTPSAFIRFVGNSLHATDYARIDRWVERIAQWQQQGLEHLYFFMHQHDELYSPELCKYLIEELNKKCGLNIPVPAFVNENNLL